MFFQDIDFMTSVKSLFGFNESSVTFKGKEASHMAKAFVAPQYSREGVISEDQVRDIHSVADLHREVDRGYRRKVGTVYEDANGKRTTSEETVTPVEEVKSTEVKPAAEETVTPVAETPSEEVIQVKPEDLYREPPKVHTAQGRTVPETEKSEEAVKPSKIEIAFKRNFEEVKIDLDQAKKRWPNEVKSRIREKTWKEYTANHGGSTGYYETLMGVDFGLPIGTVMRGTDNKDRPMMIICGDLTDGVENIIVFRRFSPEEPISPFVANMPSHITRLFQVGNTALSDWEMDVLMGPLDPNSDNLYARMAS